MIEFRMLTIPYLVVVEKEFEYYFHDSDSSIPNLITCLPGDNFWAVRASDRDNEKVVAMFSHKVVAIFRRDNVKEILMKNVSFFINEPSGQYEKMRLEAKVKAVFEFGDIKLNNV